MSAVSELRKIGAPVIEGPGGWGDVFRISGEDNFNDGETLWADYYDGAMMYPDTFGINPRIARILERHGLRAEWIDAGTVGVYKD